MNQEQEVSFKSGFAEMEKQNAALFCMYFRKENQFLIFQNDQLVCEFHGKNSNLIGHSATLLAVKLGFNVVINAYEKKPDFETIKASALVTAKFLCKALNISVLHEVGKCPICELSDFLTFTWQGRF